MSFVPATRARIYLRDSATFEGRPAYELIVQAFERAGIDDVSVHHGIMGFDPASGMLSARPLRFHPDLPVVVEAVGNKDRIETALPRIREVLVRGLITLAEVDLYTPGP
jgi:PII-like signaling protein